MSRPPFDPDRVAAPADERPVHRHDVVLTVSQLTGMVKRAIEQHLPTTIHVVGEISNFKRHSSGHLYFVLKDEHCEVACVMWRASAEALRFDPGDGLEVFATGHVDVFERSGRYQLYVRRIEPKGAGALEMAFRQLRDKLEKEGLFDPKRKRPLPGIPERVAIVTSPTGAAIQDILKTLTRRWPAVEVVVYPVTVQGPTAAGEIAAAIRHLNARAASLGGVDVMIVGRGGGSLEDLWAFNEEIVARAIHASVIPVVSAVGHESDVSISDLVADVRAATPTAAAELVVPDRADVAARLEGVAQHLTRLVGHRTALLRSALDGTLQRVHWREPATMVHRREQIIDERMTRMQHAVARLTHQAHRRMGIAEVALQRIMPEAYAARSRAQLADRLNRMDHAIMHRMSNAVRMLSSQCERFVASTPRHHVVRMKDRIEALAVQLDVMSHKRTLARGFSITRSRKKRAVIRRADQVRDDEIVVTETSEGEFESRVVNRVQRELFE